VVKKRRDQPLSAHSMAMRSEAGDIEAIDEDVLDKLKTLIRAELLPGTMLLLEEPGELRHTDFGVVADTYNLQLQHFTDQAVLRGDLFDGQVHMLTLQETFLRQMQHKDHGVTGSERSSSADMQQQLREQTMRTVTALGDRVMSTYSDMRVGVAVSAGEFGGSFDLAFNPFGQGA
jgi:hypothetical protein